MSKQVCLLIIALVSLSVLTSDGPTVVGLAKTLPALVLAVGLVVALLRLVWFVTTRDSS